MQNLGNWISVKNYDIAKWLPSFVVAVSAGTAFRSSCRLVTRRCWLARDLAQLDKFVWTSWSIAWKRLWLERGKGIIADDESPKIFNNNCRAFHFSSWWVSDFSVLQLRYSDFLPSYSTNTGSKFRLGMRALFLWVQRFYTPTVQILFRVSTRCGAMRYGSCSYEYHVHRLFQLHLCRVHWGSPFIPMSELW